jgi:hypothetical protein
MASIVDKEGNILYVSQLMQKLGSHKMKSQFDNTVINSIMQNMNNKVIQTQRTIKYIYTMQTNSTEFTFFICCKHPIYEKNNIKPVAILTTQEQFKIIDIDTYKQLDNVCTFNYIEQLILFCSYLSLSHGEIYKFITSHYHKQLQFKQFQLYCQRILETFQAASFKEVIKNNDIIRYCDSLLRKILKNGFILMKTA